MSVGKWFMVRYMSREFGIDGDRVGTGFGLVADNRLRPEVEVIESSGGQRRTRLEVSIFLRSSLDSVRLTYTLLLSWPLKARVSAEEVEVA